MGYGTAELRRDIEDAISRQDATDPLTVAFPDGRDLVTRLRDDSGRLVVECGYGEWMSIGEASDALAGLDAGEVVAATTSGRVARRTMPVTGTRPMPDVRQVALVGEEE